MNEKMYLQMQLVQRLRPYKDSQGNNLQLFKYYDLQIGNRKYIVQVNYHEHRKEIGLFVCGNSKVYSLGSLYEEHKLKDGIGILPYEKK